MRACVSVFVCVKLSFGKRAAALACLHPSLGLAVGFPPMQEGRRIGGGGGRRRGGVGVSREVYRVPCCRGRP